MGHSEKVLVSVPFTSGSSLQLNSRSVGTKLRKVSVPFTSGSSLQPSLKRVICGNMILFQFPLHRDPRCNRLTCRGLRMGNCFSSLYIGILAATDNFHSGYHFWRNSFQFPLHRDPRCNCFNTLAKCFKALVSVPFTSGSSLQPCTS